MQGRTVDDYDAPLFLAWQLTNRCGARCLACCEESGPGKAWRDELSREEALDLAGAIVDCGIPFVAFGGGEPLGVAHCWDVFDRLAAGGVALKLETDGSRIDDAAADRIAALGVDCVQISVDGATAATHQRVRPGSSFTAATGAIERLVARGCPPQFVFVPTRLNLPEIVAAYDLAAALGCSAFVTGPLMRIGRAAAAWDTLACSDDEWQRAVAALRERAAAAKPVRRCRSIPGTSSPKWRRGSRARRRCSSSCPTARSSSSTRLPFAPADLRRDSLHDAWQAYRAAWRTTEVRDFVLRCRDEPALLRHANETWALATNQ